MLGNYFRVTWHNLLKHKLYVLINVAGLTVAIASSIIIFMYARNELTFDAFHENAERIQLVYKERQTAQGVQELSDTWAPLLGVMQEQFPGISDGVRMLNDAGTWVQVEGGGKFREDVTYADSSLFNVFTFPLRQGSAESALQGRNSVVLSAELAQKYFGQQDPLGKVITVNFTNQHIVTGVLEDIPQNSSYRPDIIVPFESRFAAEEVAEANANWGNSYLSTFLLLEQNTDPASLQNSFPALVASQFGEEGANGARNMQLKLWSLLSMHNRVEGGATMAYVLLAIAFAIIIVACINFTNLSIVRALERAREVGVRKTLGSQRVQLILMFFIEPLLITGVALVLSAEIASMLLPIFNSLYGVELSLNIADDKLLLAILLAVGFAVALLSGSYPAFVMSGLRSVETLKGSLKASPKGIRVRNGLSFLQFSVAIILIIAIITALQQVRFMQTQNLNFDPENVLVIPVNVGDFADREIAGLQLETFKDELRGLPGVVSVASSMSVPGAYANANVFANPEGWLGEQPLRMMQAVADDNYFATYGMEFVEGRNFSAATGTDDSAVIINETAMRDIGWDTAVGKKINDLTVIGVVKDFHYDSLANDIRPIIHRYAPPAGNSRDNFISIKLDTANMPATLASIEQYWRTLDPSRAFTYYFVEDRFAQLHQNVINTGKVLGYFALLSIFIANLGLLGLTSYSVVQRTREIGIRRVLGSTVHGIVLLLSAQFIKPVLFANLLAWPLAYFAIQRWLESFAYRVDINWLIFPVAGVGIAVFALLTISAQSARVAGANPVKALRSE